MVRRVLHVSQPPSTPADSRKHSRERLARGDSCTGESDALQSSRWFCAGIYDTWQPGARLWFPPFKWSHWWIPGYGSSTRQWLDLPFSGHACWPLRAECDSLFWNVSIVVSNTILPVEGIYTGWPKTWHGQQNCLETEALCAKGCLKNIGSLIRQDSYFLVSTKNKCWVIIFVCFKTGIFGLAQTAGAIFENWNHLQRYSSSFFLLVPKTNVE